MTRPAFASRGADSMLREDPEDTQEIVLGSLLAAVGQLDAPQSDADLMEILERVLDSALQTVHANGGSLLVRDDETDELVFALFRGDVDSKDLLWRRLPAGEGIASLVVENGEAVLANDAQTSTGSFAGVDPVFRSVANSILAAPIVTADEVLGAIEVVNKHDGLPFSELDRLRLAQLGRVAGGLLSAMIQELDRNEPGGVRREAG